MTEQPTILTIMGSGETSPTMVKTHRENIAMLKKKSPSGVILDTPFGFQSNADDISMKAIEYFKVSVNIDCEIASFRSAEIDSLDREKFFSKLRRADFIFAGPGSPTYALRQWRNTPVPTILMNKLLKGPTIVTFSSAAALTLGSHTVPVYEIYKVGDDPDWVSGLDILGTFGIRGAVIPHFNNGEGGNHDTRYCYLGQERLELMESRLNDGESIFGIDEHTAVTINLGDETVAVSGNGTFNIRNQGRQVSFESGTTLPLSSLCNTEAFFRGRVQPKQELSKPKDETPSHQVSARDGVSPLRIAVKESQSAFEKAMAEKDMDAVTMVALTLQGETEKWETETFQSDEMEQARSALRAMILRRGELAKHGITDPEAVFGPFVELAMEIRLKAREQKHWEYSDRIREGLEGLGIEVRDIPGGSEWISIGNKRKTY